MSGRVALSPEVRAALEDGQPVVALETSVLAQGLPNPRNLEAMDAMEAAVRGPGAVPAWTAVWDGAIRVGANRDELVDLAGSGMAVMKVARRDLPAAVAGGGRGATTVSATLWAAHEAGIPVAATGGIGGVHPRTGDVSADLVELGRTPGLLVCSGPKSIVDPVATLERLEELGVSVVGYGVDRLPFFLAREAPVDLEHRADSPQDAVAMLRAAEALGTPSSLLLCNPIPAGAAMPAEEAAAAARACEEDAERRGIRGKAVTPFLLSCMAERTEGRSLEANLALLVSNAALAGQVAAAHARA